MRSANIPAFRDRDVSSMDCRRDFSETAGGAPAGVRVGGFMLGCEGLTTQSEPLAVRVDGEGTPEVQDFRPEAAHVIIDS